MTHVQILLATHNGAAYLQEQLRSFLDQDHQDWSLLASDDASTDETLDILKAFQREHPNRNIRIIAGPNKGLFANFMHLLRHPELSSGYVALSDQDDVWLPGHLSNAVTVLNGQGGNGFYCSTRILTDANLRPFNTRTPAPLPRPSFHNALVQNLAPGNTMMISPYALSILRSDPMPPLSLPYHDWWIYLRLMAAEVRLICDPRPSLLYRQHGNNFLGDRRTNRWQRLRALGDGTYGSWISANTHALLNLPSETISPEYRRAAEVLATLPSRPEALRRSRAHRHDSLGRVALPLLAAFQRI